MQFLDFGKVLEEAKKKDPNVDEGELFAKLCLGVIEQKSAYKGGEALTESELPKGFKKAVKEYFDKRTHKSCDAPFKLARLEKSNIKESVTYAVPKGVYEILEEDNEFDKGLAEIGNKFGVSVKLPWYCYAK